jgi:hypothetical protein
MGTFQLGLYDFGTHTLVLHFLGAFGVGQNR